MMLGWLLVAAALCRPAAALSGDAAVVGDLAEALEARGVLVGEVDGCASPAVHVERRGDHVLLALASTPDAPAREASDTRVAARIVESWARADLVAPLLEPPPAPKMAVAEPGSPRLGTPRLDAPAAAEDGFGLDFRARAEIGLASDRTVWWGGAAEARWPSAPLAPILSLRAATSRADLDPLRSTAQRVLGDAMLGLLYRAELGSWAVEPALLAGAGLLSSARVNGSSCTGSCAAGSRVVADGFTSVYVTPKLEANLRAGLPIAGGLGLHLFAALTLSPFAATAGFAPAYAAKLSTAEREALSLPGDASLVFRAGFGLGYEVTP